MTRDFTAMAILTCFGMAAGWAAETPSKTQGGVCFRVDDNQAPHEWLDYAKVFRKYDAKFCASINLGRLTVDSPWVKVFRELQAEGHEMMAHTPWHSVDRLGVVPGVDPSTIPGVHHANEKLMFLSYAPVDTSLLPAANRGVCDIVGNRMTSHDPKHIDDSNRNRFVAVYLPKIEKLFAFKAATEEEKVVLLLQSIWQEKNIDLGNMREVEYYKISKSDLHIMPAALNLLAERSLELFERFGLRRPLTWIQPGGGSCSNLTREAAKASFGDHCGYIAAATYPNRSLKYFNEVDPAGDKSFGMQWGNFDEEKRDLAWNKKRIADGVAKHHMLVGHSHFGPSLELGGWKGYLDRVDKLLAWCRAEGIPVRTYAEWARLLYGNTPAMTGNIFPCLDVDRDDDGVPDGYSLQVGKVVPVEDGPDGNRVALKAEKSGRVCRIMNLGGLGKGKNEFELWGRAPAGTSITVVLDFDNPDLKMTLTFADFEPGWTQQTKSVEIPPTASRAHVTVNCTSLASGTVEITGLALLSKH